MKNSIYLLIMAFGLGSLAPAPASSWSSGPETLSSILPHPSDPEKIILASPSRLFEVSKNSPWEKTGKIYPSQSRIRKILFFKQIPESLFILTDAGIFKEGLTDGKPVLIFRNRKDVSVLAFTVDPASPAHFFAATNRGLYESENAGGNWFPFFKFRQRAVNLLYFSKTRLFAASENTLFSSDDMSFFENTLFLRAPQEDLTEENFELETDFTESFPANSFHEMVSSEDGARVWVSSRKGVFASSDYGQSWKLLPRSGTKDQAILFLAYAAKTGALFGAARKTVYRYSKKEQRWTEIFSASEIKGMALIENQSPLLLILTEQGVTKLPFFPQEMEAPGLSLPAVWRTDLFRKLVFMEPAVTSLQKEIIEYNNVKNSKTKRWHAESRIASFLPSLSFGKDFSQANNIDIDRGGTSDRDQFIAGPDDIDQGWDFDVSWDLGDFIWSSNQTSIDSREKLMIELRNDLLAESTRIFYERRRLQMDAVMNPAASEAEFLEKLLAIDELTALLDGMSGGFFIKSLERLYKEHPEFWRLWEYESYSGERTAYSKENNNDKEL